MPLPKTLFPKFFDARDRHSQKSSLADSFLATVQYVSDKVQPMKKRLADSIRNRRFFKDSGISKAVKIKGAAARTTAQTAANRLAEKASTLAKNKNVATIGSKLTNWDIDKLTGDLSKKLKLFKAKTPWAGKAIKWAGATIAFQFAIQGLSRAIGSFSGPVIPEHYDRGYDVIRDNMTDFGSPLKLSKAAQKVIAPYKSTVRKATYTSVASTVRKNISLSQAANAIGHRRY